MRFQLNKRILSLLCFQVNYNRNITYNAIAKKIKEGVSKWHLALQFSISPRIVFFMILVSDMSRIICMSPIFGHQYHRAPVIFIFFEISNLGCFPKNPYKPLLFLLDSYSPAHKLSKSPINGRFLSKKNITGWSPFRTNPDFYMAMGV